MDPSSTPPSSMEDVASEAVDSGSAPPQLNSKTLPSLKNLPQLDSSFKSPKVSYWGPKLNSVPHTPTPASSPIGQTTNGTGKQLKYKTVQEALTLDLQSQLSISKQEFSKIVQSIKQEHSVSIESTLSKNSRTFLISGAYANVQAAKRELVKKMTRPVTQTITIPANCRAAVIGPGGKTIREISGDVKIDIGKDIIPDSFDEDLNDSLVNVELHGDIASVDVAKARILDIVKEETKFAVYKINLAKFDTISSFIDSNSLAKFAHDNEAIKINVFDKTGDIVISGPREDAKAIKTKIQSHLEQLSSQLYTQTVDIPEKFQVLIDPAEIKSNFNVLITKKPNDSQVQFTGLKENVEDSINFARNSSKQFVVDVLDISKSHSKNLKHAKNLILYFQKYSAQVFDALTKEYPNVKIFLPETRTLSGASVPIIITAKSENANEIKTVRKELISLVNNITPLDTLTIDDLSYELFHSDIQKILSTTEDEVPFVQLGDYLGSDNDSVFLVTLTSNDDFKPSAEEVLEKLNQISGNLDPVRAKQQNLKLQVFDMAAEFQDEVFHDGSITYGLLLNEISHENGNLQIKLHTPNKNQITVRGNEKAVNIVSKAISSILESPGKNSKLSFEIPANSVSRLIGNKGSNLQQLEEKFDCSINVADNKANEPSVEVTLTGLEYNLQFGKKYITAEAKKWADTITKELIVPSKYHRKLMGPQNSYRNRLQDKYSVRINFPKSDGVVTIKGPSRGANKAYEEMKALLDFEMENGHQTIVKVPTEHVARIIGKNGETINDIRADFGVELDFLQNASDSAAQEAGFVELEITGSRQAIKDATKRVETIVTEASDYTTDSLEVDHEFHRFIVGPGGSKLREIISAAGGDELRSKSVQIPDSKSDETTISIQGSKAFVSSVIKQIKQIVEGIKNRIDKEIDVPTEKYGTLIGPGGSTLRKLETEFECSIDVPNKNEANGKVKISGLPENVNKLEDKIMKEIIKDDFDAELEVPASAHEFVSERGAFIQQLRLEQFVNVKHGNSTRRANKLSRSSLNIPVEKVVAESEQSGSKVNIVYGEVDVSSIKPDEEPISWRLTYEPIDTNILNFTDDGDVDDAKKKKKEEQPKDAADKKDERLQAAMELIKARMALAENANAVAYIWAADPKRFNKIVGPGGSTVKAIREKTGTIINVPRKSDKINNIVYVRGTNDNVRTAAETIAKLLK